MKLLNYWVHGQKQCEADETLATSHKEAIWFLFAARNVTECGPTKYDYVSELGGERKYWRVSNEQR